MDVGATLRRTRESRGLTLDRLSHVTHITLPILKAIEQNDRAKIPPRPYGRGFVRAYASEVGLDADQVVHEFFSQFAPPPDTSPPPPPHPHGHLVDQRSAEPVAMVVAWGIVAIVALIIFGGTLPRGGTPEAVGTSGSAAPTAANMAGTPAPSPLADTTAREVTVVLEATGPSWVTAHVDGRRSIYRTLQPGEREVLRAREEIRIRTGDAGALRWQVGAGRAVPMGKPGEVRSARITPEQGSPKS